MTNEIVHTREIAGLTATRLEVDVGDRSMRLWAVPDLEGLVDRGALLRGEAEPPYWAYLWSGARVLASYLVRFVDVRGLRVLEIGCGLALPGIAAAVLGAEATLVDVAAPALAFADASAAANHVACTTLASDFTRLDPELQFDVVLAAEIAYDRARYHELAAVFVRHLRPGGIALLADGYRTDTRGLYAALAASGCATHAFDLRVDEEGRPMPVRLTVIRHPAARISSRDIARRPA
ncbi:MAG: methyltransferase domain-containing protein [Candidatus Binatia bacterium]